MLEEINKPEAEDEDEEKEEEIYFHSKGPRAKSIG
jgi:hypothetical protein